MVLLGGVLEFSWVPVEGVLPGSSQNWVLKGHEFHQGSWWGQETGGLSLATQFWLGLLHWEKLRKHCGLELASLSASTAVKDPNTGLPWLRR